MSPPLVPKPIIRALAAVLELDDGSRPAADETAVLDVLAQTIGATVAIGVRRAHVRLRAGDLLGARRILDSLDGSHPDQPAVKALLALCLCGLDDPMWESVAREVYALPPDENGRALVDFLAKLSNINLDRTESPSEPAAGASMATYGIAC
jgi:hypothetical protein